MWIHWCLGVCVSMQALLALYTYFLACKSVCVRACVRAHVYFFFFFFLNGFWSLDLSPFSSLFDNVILIPSLLCLLIYPDFDWGQIDFILESIIFLYFFLSPFLAHCTPFPNFLMFFFFFLCTRLPNEFCNKRTFIGQKAALIKSLYINLIEHKMLVSSR